MTGSDAVLPPLQAYDEPLLGVLKLLFPGYNNTAPELTPAKLRELIINRNQLQKDNLDQWRNEKVDGLIAPVNVPAAARLQMDPQKVYGGFSGFANVMDLPGCTFPVTYADKTLDPRRGSEWVPSGLRDQFVQSDYDPEFWHGAPVGLQVIGQRLEEEKVLELTQLIANAIDFEDRVYG